MHTFFVVHRNSIVQRVLGLDSSEARLGCPANAYRAERGSASES